MSTSGGERASPLACKPVIIIGAPRSGTNMLRDVLTQLPGCGTWPCDEINYIWRHGNVRYPNDEFGPAQATPTVARFLRRAFHRLAVQRGLSFVVEKTCASSLRVSFVDRIFPRAHYVFIVRDGRDSLASAMKRWAAPLDLRYTLRKARFVPLTDVPYYGARFLWNRAYRLLSRKNRLSFWGPRFKGMQDMARSRSLAEICAAQWARCVDKATDDLAQIDPVRVHCLRYEEFVLDPRAEVRRLCASLGIVAAGPCIEAAIAPVRRDSIGKWRKELPSETLDLVMPLLAPSLKRHGYT